MQTILALTIVGLAAVYMIYRAVRKNKSGCNCGCTHSAPPRK